MTTPEGAAQPRVSARARSALSLALCSSLAFLALYSRAGRAARDLPPATPSPELRLESQTAALVARLAAAEQWEPESLGGFGNARSRVHACYVRLRSTASADELTALCDRHPDPKVRVYAFMALAERGEDVFDLLQRRLSDLAWVDTAANLGLRGHPFGGRWRVADMVLHMAWSGTGLAQHSERLNEAQRRELTDQVLARPRPLRFQAWLLEQLGCPAAHYEAVRALASSEAPAALLALARYRRPRDVKVIAAAMGSGRHAAAESAMAAFPDPAFLPLLAARLARLRDSSEREQLSSCYRALAAQRSAQAAGLLATAITEGWPEPHLEALQAALLEHLEQDVYAALLPELLDAQLRLDRRVLARIGQLDPTALLARFERLFRRLEGEAVVELMAFLERERSPTCTVALNACLRWAGHAERGTGSWSASGCRVSLTKHRGLAALAKTHGDAETLALLADYARADPHPARQETWAGAAQELRRRLRSAVPRAAPPAEGELDTSR